MGPATRAVFRLKPRPGKGPASRAKKGPLSPRANLGGASGPLCPPLPARLAFLKMLTVNMDAVTIEQTTVAIL